jgi:hypothetical protein
VPIPYIFYSIPNISFGQEWWLMTVIPTTQRWRWGGSQFVTLLGKNFERPYLNQ